MLIKNVNRNVKDVFFGTGWNEWVRLDKSGSVIAGAAPRAVIEAFKRRVK